MAENDSFHEVMARLRVGDQDAATRVFHQFARGLIALAQTRLQGRLRQKVDPEDVLQSVYKSFFVRHGQGQWQVESWDGLWAILTVITLRKCGRWTEVFQTERRDVLREVRTGDSPDAGAVGAALLSREPTPPEAAILTETVERLLGALEGRERDIVTLALQGHTVEEISSQVGRTRRTVQRVLKRVKDELHQV
jgi:RNA polymerase sigma-70 factor (ECF subfamily)